MSTPEPRLIIDISTLARWQGPPVGIPRCQAKYAEYALRELPQAVFTIFDPRNARYRPMSRDAADAIITGRMKPELTMMPDPTRVRRRTIDSVPTALQPAYWWVTKLRRKLLERLEDWRLRSLSEATRKRIASIQDWLITPKLRGLYYDSANLRIERPSLDSIVGAPLELTSADTTLAMQSDWSHTSISAIAAMRQKAGSRHVVLCHDIIPILFPQWYSDGDVKLFTTYYDQAFAVADKVIFTSHCSRRDADVYCKSIGAKIADSAVVPMGTDVLPRQPVDGGLPQGLSKDRYVLYVSTIEPRKNHAMLVEAWRWLVRQGMVEATGFKMVFVGRPGWMMGSFFEDLRNDKELAGTIVHLTGITDQALAALYQHAAFCVYPPLYEGYGLPPVEALASGKAVIASSAGPIAEIVGDFAVCLDPNDVDAWTAQMGAWMQDTTDRNRYAARAASEYQPLSWEASSESFYEAVAEVTKPETS